MSDPNDTPARRRLADVGICAAPGPLFLLAIAGGVCLAAGSFLPEHTTRETRSPSSPGGGRAVIRLDMPAGWHVQYRSRKHGNDTAMFAADGVFAFQIDRNADPVYDPTENRWRGYLSLDEFLGERRAWGEKVERLDGPGGEFGVARTTPSTDNLTRMWGVASARPPAQVTYYSHPRQLCVQFLMRGADAARFEPDALQLFLAAELLPATDPRADNRVLDPEAHERNAVLRTVGWWGIGAGLGLCFALGVGRAVRAGEGVGPRPARSAGRRSAGTRAGEGGRTGGAGARAARSRRPRVRARRVVRPRRLRRDARERVAAPDAADGRVRPVLPLDREVPTTLRPPVRRRVDSGEHDADDGLVVLAPPEYTYLQMRRPCTAEVLWAWHLDAETLFPARSRYAGEVAPTPIDLYTEMSRRVARRHRRHWFWILRYDPFGEAWRMFRMRGASVREQIDRGLAIDPAMTFPEPEPRDE